MTIYGAVSSDVATEDYAIPDVLMGSSGSAEPTIIEIIEYKLSASKRNEGLRQLYGYLRGLYEIDFSSVYPHFESMTETSLVKDIHEWIKPKEMLEFDVIVSMPPIKRYTIELNVKNIIKAEPRIIEPE